MVQRVHFEHKLPTVWHEIGLILRILPHEDYPAVIYDRISVKNP